MNDLSEKVINDIRQFIKNEGPQFLSDFEKVFQSMKHEKELFFWFSSGDRKIRFEQNNEYEKLLNDLYFSIH